MNTDDLIATYAIYGDIKFCLRHDGLGGIRRRDALPTLHDHAYYELHIVREGDCTFWLPDGQLSVFAGQFLLIAPKTEHYSYLPQNEGFANSVLTFTVERIDGDPPLFDDFCRYAAAYSLTPTMASPSLCSLVGAFCNSFGDGVRDRLMRQRQASEIVFLLLEALGLPEQSKPAIRPDEKRPADPGAQLEWMVDRPDMSLTAVARALGYSERQTARLIHDRFGMSLTELRNHRRLETVRKLLIERPTMSLYDICTVSGFRSHSAFHQAFKKEYGCTPAVYRAAQLQRINEQERTDSDETR